MPLIDDVEDVTSSRPSEVRVRFKDTTTEAEDPDTIEVLLDSAQVDVSGTSGDSASGGVESPYSRRPRVEPSALGRLLLRIARQCREFRSRLARRFSKLFRRRRRRYDVMAASPEPDDSATATFHFQAAAAD